MDFFEVYIDKLIIRCRIWFWNGENLLFFLKEELSIFVFIVEKDGK